MKYMNKTGYFMYIIFTLNIEYIKKNSILLKKLRSTIEKYFFLLKCAKNLVINFIPIFKNKMHNKSILK